MVVSTSTIVKMARWFRLNAKIGHLYILSKLFLLEEGNSSQTTSGLEMITVDVFSSGLSKQMHRG